MKLIKRLPDILFRRTPGKANLVFWLIVLPMLLTAVYLLAVAKDRYVSEATVVVKRSSDIEGSGLNLGMLLGAANPVAREDAMYLKEYILSLDMLKRLDAQLKLRQEFGSAGPDLLHRLPADATQEQFLDYYRNRVEVAFDEKSSLLTIRTIGFSPLFALRFNKAVLAESERFINELSHGIAREQMRYAQSELDQSYARLNGARERLLAYQNKNGVLDPQAKAEAASKVIAEMEARLAQMEAEQRNLLAYLNADAPQVQAMTNGLNALRAQIAAEKAKLAAPEGDKLNRKAAQFLELKAQAEFNADLYRLSLTAVEKVRIEAARKLKNLVVVVSPQLAEEAEYPRKLHILGTLLLCLFLLFGVTKLVIAIVEDHKD